MKPKKNLSRFDYETSAFEGWRLSITKTGNIFTRYFPDRKFGSAKKSLVAAERALAEVKAILDGSKMVSGKLTATTIKKVAKVLADAA